MSIAVLACHGLQHMHEGQNRRRECAGSSFPGFVTEQVRNCRTRVLCGVLLAYACRLYYIA